MLEEICKDGFELFNQLPIKIFYKDINLNFIAGNKSFLSELSLSQNELEQKNDYDMPWHIFADHYREIDREVLIKNKIHKRFEVNIDNTGNLHKVFVTKKPFTDKHNKILGIVGIYEKIDGDQNNTFALLSKRQKQIFYYIVQGKTAKQIADILQLNFRTIQYYIEIIKNKLNCRTKSDIVRFFYAI